MCVVVVATTVAVADEAASWLVIENTMKIIHKDLKLFCTWIFSVIVFLNSLQGLRIHWPLLLILMPPHTRNPTRDESEIKKEGNL